MKSQERAIMAESFYVQGNMEIGATRVARRLIIAACTKRFGDPDEDVLGAIDRINEVEVFE